MAPLSLSSWRRLVNLRAKDRALASVPGGAPGTTAVTFNTDVATLQVEFDDKFPEINSQTKRRLAIRSAKCADSSTSKVTGCTQTRRTSPPSPHGSHNIDSSSLNFKATSLAGGPLASAIPPPIPVGGVVEHVQGNDTVSPTATTTLICGGPSTRQGNSSSTTVLSSSVSQPVITLSTGAPAAGAGNEQTPSKSSTGGGPSSTTSLVNTQTSISGGSIQLTSSGTVSLTLSTNDRGAIPNVTGSPTPPSKGAVRVIDGTATDGGASDVSFTTTMTSNSDVASGTPTPLTTQSTQVISISSPPPTTGTQVVPGVSAFEGSESSTKTDALIGGCIGAAFLILAGSVLLFLHFRRRRRNEEKRETFITATPYPFPVEASYSPSTSEPPSSASKLITMHTDLPTMPRPTFLGVDTPAMSEKPPARTPLGRKLPVPFLDHPVLNQRMGGPTSSSPASLQVIVHQHTMMSEDPLGDPGRNMSGGPLPAVQAVGGTRRLKKRRSIAAFFSSQSTVREYGVAL